MRKAELPEGEKLLINEEHSFEFPMTGNKNQNPKKTSLLLNYFMFTIFYVIAPTTSTTATPTKEL